MGFKTIAMALIVLFASVILTTMAMFNLVPLMIYIAATAAIGIIAGVMMLLTELLVGSVSGPFLEAKMQGKTLIANLTASKKIEFLTGNEREGMIKTKRGQFFIVPDASYLWPCGIKGGFSYFKYGLLLPKNFVNMATALKKQGINDIDELTLVNKALAEKKQDVQIEV